MADKKYSVDDILRIFSKLEKKIEDLACFVKECCAKIPVNVGTGIGLFKKFNQNKWEFKSLIAGDNVVITEQSNTITINSTAEPFTCQDVDTCLGISELGSPTKFLNEQGDFTSVGGSEFTCSSLNSCSTTNLPEGSNLYFLDERAQDAVGNILTNSSQITFTYNDGVPSISAAFASNNISQFTNDSGYVTCTGVTNCVSGTQTQIAYFHPTTGKITSDSYFTRIANGETTIIGDIFGQDGGYIKLNPTGNSYFGVYVSGTLTNNFWVNAGNLGWDWNGTSFTLPINDGNPNYVMITDGFGVLSFVDVNTIVTGGGLITAIADTNTVDLTETSGTLTADVNYQNSADINLSEDAGGLKAEFASHNISQFTNNSGYFVNGGALSNGTTATTQVEGDNSTKVATTAYVDKRPVYLNRSKRWEWFVDFEANPASTFSSEESNFAGTATAAFSALPSTGNNVGVVSMDTGTNASAAAVAGTAITTIQFGNGVTYTESLIQIPTLSTNTQRFKTYTGFLDVITSVADGAYISQVDNENSGNWIFTCVNGGVATSFNLSTAPTAGTWYKIGVSINAAGTEARCYINGVEPSGAGYPITTNIPTSSTSQTGVRTGLVKSVGTTSRSLYVDYLYGRIDFTTPR